MGKAHLALSVFIVMYVIKHSPGSGPMFCKEMNRYGLSFG